MVGFSGRHQSLDVFAPGGKHSGRGESNSHPQYQESREGTGGEES
jgi:hypothetical protein